MARPGDFVESMGALTLAHRFKRMMSRLLQEARIVYRELDVPIQPRWCSTLLLLHEAGPLSVKELAARLRLSHPAVVQIVDAASAAGLVRRGRDANDGRRRRVALTAEGRRWLPLLRGVWAELARAQEELFRSAGCDVLSVLDAANRELDERPLSGRVLARLPFQKASPTGEPMP